MSYNMNMGKKINKLDYEQYIKDQAKILLHMKRFRNAVTKFREKYKLTEKRDPDDELLKAYLHIFLNALFFIGSNSKALSEYQDEFTKMLPKDKNILKDLEILAGSFNLDSKWYAPLFNYIALHTKELDIPLPQSIEICPRYNDVRLPVEDQVITRLGITISKDTSISDIIDVWPKIKKYQKMMRGNQVQKRKMIEPKTVTKYVKIRKLEDKGLKLREIAKKMNFDTRYDVSYFKRDVEDRFKPPKK